MVIDYLRNVQFQGGQDDRVERGHGLKTSKLRDGLLSESSDVVDLDRGVREEQVRHHPLVPSLAHVDDFAVEDLGRAGQDFGQFNQVRLRREVTLIDPDQIIRKIKNARAKKFGHFSIFICGVIWASLAEEGAVSPYRGFEKLSLKGLRFSKQ